MRDFRILIVVVAAVCLLAGCGRKKVAVPDGVEAYCFDDAVVGEDLSEVFTDVALIPLEFSGEYYPRNPYRLEMTDSLILVYDLPYDMNSRLTVFDIDGKYVSSSEEKFGQGPEEFTICLGFGWNPYSRLIEIIGFQKIMFYDKEFNFVRSCKAPNKVGDIMIGEIFDLSPTRHILLANHTKDSRIFLFDSEKGEILDVNNYEEWRKGCGACSQRNRFFRLPDGEVYCMPLKVTDKILKLNTDSLTFENIVRFLPGKNTVTPEEYEEMAANGEETGKKIYQMNKEYPWQMMFNSKKIFNSIAIGEWRYKDLMYFVDRRSGEMKKYNLFNEKTRIFPDIDYIDEEYAYWVIEKERLAKAPRLLLDKAEKKDSILGTIEDESLIVLKYRIRD